MCWDFDATFVADLSAPAAARTAVTDALTTRFRKDVPESTVDDAKLVVSELVTAAVRSQARSIEVTGHVHHGELWLEVLSVDPAADGHQDNATVSEIGTGRGAQLVDAVATIQGETHGARGTVVWAMLETPSAMTNSMGCDLAPRSAILATAS